VQALQQQIDEMSANHEAAIEAIKTAHCQEMESLKNTLSSQMATDASGMFRAGPENSIQSSSMSDEAGEAASVFKCGLCHQNSLLDAPRSVRDLAALYHNECRRNAVLQSRLNNVSKFIAYIDDLDQPADDDSNNVDSGKNSHASILAEARTFALSFRQMESDFLLQVENLQQRMEKCSLHCMQLSLSDGEVCGLLPSTELLASNNRQAPDYPEISSTLVAAVCDDAVGNGSESSEVNKVTDLLAVQLETKESEIAALTKTVDNLKEMLSSQCDELSSALRNKDEELSTAREKHRSELAELTENFEKRILELKSEHHRTMEEYRQRIVDMERSDVELNTQLLAVTEKFNSVTEFTAGAELAIAEYRSKAEKWSAEREDLMRAAEAADAKLSEREAEIAALKEQLRVIEPASDIVNATSADVDLINHDNNDTSQPVENSPHLSSQIPDISTTSPGGALRENDELVKQRQENFNVPNQQQEQSEVVASLTEQHRQTVEQMRLEHRAAIRDLEDQHNTKIIQLMKDFNTEMATHEKELRESINSDRGW